ncbi:MAG: four helix bundle protein [Flavobacteriaceae bacterium]|jgi:four helix bundle protein
MEKPYNLEERTYLFAKDCRIYIKNLPKTISNIEDSKQLVRSSGSVAANYIEGNEKLGEKDLIFKIKISRKEAKESLLWIKLLEEMNPDEKITSKYLKQEAEEIRKILSAMIKKLER